MGLFKRLVNKASRWVRKQRDDIIDRAEEALEDLKDSNRLRLLWRYLREQLPKWGIEQARNMLGREFYHKLGPMMEKLEPWQRQLILDEILRLQTADL